MLSRQAICTQSTVYRKWLSKYTHVYCVCVFYIHIILFLISKRYWGETILSPQYPGEYWGECPCCPCGVGAYGPIGNQIWGPLGKDDVCPNFALTAAKFLFSNSGNSRAKANSPKPRSCPKRPFGQRMGQNSSADWDRMFSTGVQTQRLVRG